MITRFTQSAIWFVAILAIYWLYALLVVPWIEPSPRLVSAGETNAHDAGASGDRGGDSIYARLFPPESWELDQPKVLETDRVTLLFRDYQPLEENTIRLQPVTLIFYTPRDETKPGDSRRPIVMQAPEGAVLHFDGPLDLARADVGKLTDGRLLGNVTLRSPETQPGAGDPLYLETRNIQIEPHRIWTPHPVNFRLGNHYGSGRDLSIQLEEDGEGTGESGSVQSLELVRVDSIHLQLPEGGPLAEDAGESRTTRLPGTQAAAVTTAPPETVSVEITCQGPFRLNLQDNVASFEDQVDVTRLNPDGPSDQLSCQLLSIFFHRTASDETAQPVEPAPGEAADEPESPMSIERIVAIGAPVTLNAPSTSTVARGERLEYDFLQRRFRLEGTDKVMFRHEEHQFEAPRFEYELAENERRLGKFWAAGPGVLRSIAANPEDEAVEASWSGEALLRTHGGHKVVSLYDRATVGSSSGQLSAGDVHIYLLELPREDDPEKFRVVVDQLLAERDVQVSSDRATGSAQRLMVWFRELPELLDAAEPMGSGQHHPLVRVPANDTSAKPKIDIQGGQVYARLARRGDETLIEQITVEQGVKLHQQGGTPELTALSVYGESLELTGDKPENMYLRIVGQPARVSGVDWKLAAPTIQLRGDENRLWTDGPGEMGMLPSRQGPPATAGPGLAGPPQELTIRWAGPMHFDGLNGHFRESVHVHGRSFQENGEVRELVAKGDQLDVALYQPVQFGRPHAQEEAKLRHLLLHGECFAESRAFSTDGLQRSLEWMVARDLQIDHQTGKIQAAGPGWLRAIRPGKMGLVPGQQAVAAPPSSTDFILLNVVFRGGLAGNLHQQVLEFMGHERTVYAPATSWDDIHQEEPFFAQRERAVVLTSDRLLVASRDGRSMELEAIGNALVDSSQYAIRGHRMTYDQQKGLLVVEGDGRNNVLLQHKNQSQTLAVGKVHYWPETESIDLQQIPLLDVQLSPTSTRPLTPRASVPAPGRSQ